MDRVLALAREDLDGELSFEPPGPEGPEGGPGVRVPVESSEGRVAGALRYVPADERDADHDRPFVKLIARLVGERLRDARDGAAPRGAATRIRGVLDAADLTVVFQPIADLETGRVVGVEALTRFPGGEPQRPDRWFQEAAACELGAELELLAVQRALEHLGDVPPGAYLSLNCSPSTMVSRRFADLLAGCPLDRIVIEVTEHAAVSDYERLNAALTCLREGGARVAIDDAGSGFASLRHILRMSPDIIKLDVSLTRGIDQDPVQRALSFSLAAFASAVDAEVVAEGIETQAEYRALRFLQVNHGQGFYLGAPTSPPLPRAVDFPSFSPTTVG